MQVVSPTLYQILLSSERDLTPVDLFEFYPPTVTDLIPANAERRFASTSLVWFGWQYEQQAINRSDISRFMTEKFNSVNITLSNVDNTVSAWLNSISLEGYRVLVRTVSRRYDTDSLVLFVGRCEKPGDIDNVSVTITAKQDLGTIENELPFGKYELKCPLKFKGTDCLAGQTLAQKPQAYKEASTCNKSWSQCVGYGNQKAFQGFRYKAVIGSFKVNTRPAGMGALFGSRRATKQWTSTDNFPIGQSIPLGLGRTQIDLQPVLYADTGEYLYGHFVAGEGPITEFADVRNTTAGWATTFQTLYKHNGQYGYNADQETDSALLGLEYYSSRAYVEATIQGNNPDAGDPAPTLAALVLWNKIPSIGYAGFDVTDFSDNPVEHVRYLLTDPRALNYPTTWIDDEVSYQTAEYCNEPLQDDSGCEEFWYDQNQGTAGTDWKRYRSTGLLDSAYYKYQLTPTDANRPQKIAAEYNAYDPENPPENPIPTTYYRKRYTSNWHLKEPVRVADFLFKHLLPSFRGYLVTGADGKLQIKSERSAISSLMRVISYADGTGVEIEDVTALQKLQLNQLYVVVGAGLGTSETKLINSIQYTVNGNSLTLSVTQGASRYSANFVGGSTSTQAWNYLTVNDNTAPVIVTVDGQTITASAIDATGATATYGAIAGEIAAKINAHAILGRYIEAVWNKNNPEIVLLRCKWGYVTFDTGLVYQHNIGESVVYVNGVFGDEAFGVLSRANIIRDSFKWPLGQRQNSYNQFAITYTDSTQDFQQTELRENDYEHQDKVNKINKLEISGACVDNYHQADRLVQAARYKYRDGDYFCSFQAAGSALLLEEGDIICVNHANMSGRRNELFRIEELRVTQDHRVNIVARLYSEQQFPSAATVRTVGLNTGSVWIAGTPPAVTGVTVTYSTIDSGRVNFEFGSFVGGQTARVDIKRPGDADWIPTGYEVTPDSLGRGAAELPGLKVNTLIRITPISSTGVEGASSQVTVTSPLYQWPTSYPATSGYVLSSTTGGVLSWVAQSGGGNAFGTVAVSGQSDVVAEQAGDTLTLVAGSNITLTTNATNDSITIASTASGGGNAFGIIAAAGQTTVTADQASDTLTLVAGSGITITTDANNDSVTIASAITLPNAFGTIAISGQSNVVADQTTDTLTLVAGANLLLTADASTDAITIALADGDTGDILISASGATWTIDANAVTLGKIQQIATNRLLGRVSASTGNVEEITPGTGVMSFLQTPSSANLAAAITDETGSGALVFATSPSLISPDLGTPSAVTLTNATNLPLSGIVSQLSSTLVGRRSGSSGPPETISLGTGLTMSGTTLSSSAATSPGGSTTQVQFNDAGSFGGDAGLTYDKTTDALTVVGSTQMSELRLKESAGGSDYVGFKAPASVTSNRIWTLPDGDGTNGQFLSTNGSGVLSFATAGAGVIKVKNTSGTTAVVNDVGVINNAGEYKTTTTEAFGGAWCVVIVGAANNSDIWVARRGRVTVTLSANCSIGDRLVTSTTAGRARPYGYDHYNMFAVALTANTSGAGGTCEALLYTGSAYYYISSDNEFFSVNDSGGVAPSRWTEFTSTISGAPTATSVVYGAFTGYEETLNIKSTNLTYLRLYNSTRNNFRNIISTNISTNTITTESSTGDGWANGDSINIYSQTTTVSFTAKYVTLQIRDTTTIPALSRAVTAVWLGAVTASGAIQYHPHETYATGKVQPYYIYSVGNVGDYFSYHATIPLVDRKLSMRLNSSGETRHFAYTTGAFIAVP